MRLPPTWSDEGIHLARELRRRFGELGVIILSGYEHDVQLHYATQALSDLVLQRQIDVDHAEFAGRDLVDLHPLTASPQVAPTSVSVVLGGSGGMGYLFKDRISRSILKEAVQRVASGGIVVDPLFSQQAAEEYRGRHSTTKGFSAREVEVLDLLVQGFTNKEIADKLYLSTAVIERHLTRIFRQVLPSGMSGEIEGDSRRENRRVLTVLEWLRRTGRLT